MSNTYQSKFFLGVQPTGKEQLLENSFLLLFFPQFQPGEKDTYTTDEARIDEQSVILKLLIILHILVLLGEIYKAHIRTERQQKSYHCKQKIV